MLVPPFGTHIHTHTVFVPLSETEMEHCRGNQQEFGEYLTMLSSRESAHLPQSSVVGMPGYMKLSSQTRLQPSGDGYMEVNRHSQLQPSGDEDRAGFLASAGSIADMQQLQSRGEDSGYLTITNHTALTCAQQSGNLGTDRHAEPQLNSDSTSGYMTILSSTTGNQPHPRGNNANNRSGVLDVPRPNSWIHQSPVSSCQPIPRHSSQRISSRLPAENDCEYVTIPGHAARSVTLQSTGEPVYVEIETRM